MTITINAAQVRRFEDKLERLNSRGILFAELETVNRAAFETMKDARQQLSGKMTLRNQWTKRSILVRKANRTTLEASVGSTQQYMATQEIGGREDATGKNGVAIPTSVASGEGLGAKPRKKMVRRPNRVSRITLTGGKKRTPKTRKQVLLFKVQDAVWSGKRVIFHDFGGGKKKGFFKVKGGSRSFKRGWPKGARLNMLYDLSRKSVNIPRNPWLMPAARQQVQQLPRYYSDALQRQLKRLR
jgi:hypothetical protein